MRINTLLCFAVVFLCPFSSALRAADELTVLVKQLKDKDEVVRLKAAKAIGKMGAEAREVLPDLFFAADDPDPDVRAVAKQAIKNIQEDVKNADRKKKLPILERNVKDAKSPDAKTRAAGVAGLATNLKDSDESIRLKAVQALVELGPNAVDALPALREASKSDDPAVRPLAKKAVEALQTVAAKKGNSKLDPLIKDVRSKDKATRLKALDAVAELGPEGKEAGQAVVEATLDKTPAVATKAYETLEKIDPLVYKRVYTIMLEPDLGGRRRAIDHLADMGSDGKAAVPVLFVAAQDRNLSVRALKALASVAPDDPHVADAVLRTIGEQNLTDANLRSTGLSLLEKVSIPADKTEKEVKALVFALNASDFKMRADVAKALGRIGPPAKDAISALNKLKNDLSIEVREAAAGALEKIQAK